MKPPLAVSVRKLNLRTVTITDDVKQLRPGMTASADIVTDTREKAVSVPLQSVTVRTAKQLETEGKTYNAADDGFVEIVFVVSNGKTEARQVKTGIQGDTLIEITDGVSLGDTIVTGSYRAISRELSNNSDVIVTTEKN